MIWRPTFPPPLIVQRLAAPRREVRSVWAPSSVLAVYQRNPLHLHNELSLPSRGTIRLPRRCWRHRILLQTFFSCSSNTSDATGLFFLEAQAPVPAGRLLLGTIRLFGFPHVHRCDLQRKKECLKTPQSFQDAIAALGRRPEGRSHSRSCSSKSPI